MEINSPRVSSITQMVTNEEEEYRNVRQLPQLITFDDVCDDLQESNSDPIENKVQNLREFDQEALERNNQIHRRFQTFLGDRRGNKNIGNNNAEDLQQGFGNPDGRLIKHMKDIACQEKVQRQQQQFIIAFNQKPQNAINEYVRRKVIPEDSPKQIAKYLFNIEGLNKISLGEYFGKNKQNILQILNEFCLLLEFKNLEFDLALRKLLFKFRLPGQSQQIERVVWQFSLAFYQQNKAQYKNPQQLHVLSYAIIMLATDAHNPQQLNKMKKQAFIKNTQYGCPSISSDYLSKIYDRITVEKLQTEVSYIETLYSRLKDVSTLNIKQALELGKKLMEGDVFLKSCRSTNKFVQRKLFLSSDQQKILWVSDPPIKDQTPRFIFIKDIIDLSLGLVSEVMVRNKVPQKFDSMCFTIYTVNRTLDLKAKTNTDRANWVNYIRSILLHKRQERKSKMEIEHANNWSQEKIQQIWYSQIFQLWDKHWDFKNSRPKKKGYIARGLETICSCWRTTNKDIQENIQSNLHLEIKSTLLQTLWKYGLPASSRKKLWPEVIGNNLALTPFILQEIKKRRRTVSQFRKYRQYPREAKEMAEILIAYRPDLPPVQDLIILSQVVYNIIPLDPQNKSDPLKQVLNIIHSHHFLTFYRNDPTQIQIRFSLFQFLLGKNCRQVSLHFTGLRIQTKMYLLSWFLTVFATCFTGQFLYRIWDNFLLQGECYLFKVGLTIIKYHQIQLKMCTFDEGLNILRNPKNVSSVLFFHILENQIDVKEQYYDQYVQRRKHAIIKTKVQSIPLQ